MDGKIIKLLEPVTSYDRRYEEIVLREPRGELLMRLGQPRIPVTNFSAGSGYYVEPESVIKDYLVALIVIEKDDGMMPYAEALLNKLSLADSLRLRAELFNFFDLAALKSAAKPSDSPVSASI